MLRILLTIALLGTFSAAADNVSEKHFSPINSLTESLPQKSKAQINLIIDTTTTLSQTNSSAQHTSSSVEFSSSSVTLDSSSAAVSSDSAKLVEKSTHAKGKPNPYSLPNELMTLWNSMTMRQKAAQMIMVFLTTPQFVIENEIGGVLITGKHFREVDNYLKKIAELDTSLKIPLLIATDQEGGIVNRLASIHERWHNLPSAREMRHMDTAKIYSTAQSIGHALHEYKINMHRVRWYS